MKRNKTIGLDRIDSKKGYEVGNIRSSCTTCNIMKMNLSSDEYIKKCLQIEKHLTLVG